MRFNTYRITIWLIDDVMSIFVCLDVDLILGFVAAILLEKPVDSNSHCNSQKQLSGSVLKKRCSENMQQIYRRTPMLKCDFNKEANENQPLITINMAKMYPVEADTKVIYQCGSHMQPYPYHIDIKTVSCIHSVLRK